MKLIIKQSTIGGFGSYAPRNIKKGELIRTMTGKKITEKQMFDMLDNNTLREDDPLNIGNRNFLILDEPSRLINHSCDPSCGMKNVCDLFAIKDIKKGEEITFDYSSTVEKYFNWHMDCHCGSKNCRKNVGNITTVPKQQLDYYKSLGALPDFIKNNLN